MELLENAVISDERLRDVVMKIHRLYDIDLLSDSVQVLDTYKGGDWGIRRWVVYDEQRGFGLLGDTSSSSENPLVMFTSSLFLTYHLDPDQDVVNEHKALTAEAQAELARRFSDPIDDPFVSVAVPEQQALAMKLLISMFRAWLGWDRVSIVVTPSTVKRGATFNYYANPEGAWGDEHDILKKMR